MQPLPWAPVDVNQPGALWKTCPNSPPTRLVAGMTVQVTPGNPNRLRDQAETGNVIGQIPPGATFTVNDGPICGATAGLTWWQVTYNGTEGWTAEGQGSDYWIAPVS